MIVLDTNVISELVRIAPNPQVASWMANLPRGSLFTTSITQAEVFFGVALLSVGRRKARLIEAYRNIFFGELEGQILPFDSHAALAYVQIAADRRMAGRPITSFDAQIASIARSRGAAVATRNVADFTGCGIEVIDPWDT